MKKNKKIGILLALAVIFTLIAGFFTYSYLSPARATLYVFNTDCKAGTQITGSILTPVQVDSSVYIAGSSKPLSSAFVTPNTINAVLKNADTLKVDVTAGTPLMPGMLSMAGGSEIEVAMSPSSIGLTVPVSDVTGISNELSRESHVNVYVTYRSSGTQLLLENMRILAVQKTNGVLSSVTLEVDNNQSLMLIDASNNGVLYLGLVNAKGYQYVVGDDPVTDETDAAAATESTVPATDPGTAPPTGTDAINVEDPTATAETGSTTVQ